MTNNDRDEWLKQIGVYDEIAELKWQLQEAQQANALLRYDVGAINELLLSADQRAFAAEAQCATQAKEIEALNNRIIMLEDVLAGK